MNGAYPILTLEQAFDEALNWLTCRLSAARLRVVRTFDLQDTFGDPAECPCQHPPGEVCTCRMVVLLVYGDGCSPTSLIALGNHARACFALVDSPQQPVEPGLACTIREALRMDELAVVEGC